RAVPRPANREALPTGWTAARSELELREAAASGRVDGRGAAAAGGWVDPGHRRGEGPLLRWAHRTHHAERGGRREAGTALLRPRVAARHDGAENGVDDRRSHPTYERSRTGRGGGARGDADSCP